MGVPASLGKTFVFLGITYVPAVALSVHFLQHSFHSDVPIIVIALAWLLLIQVTSTHLAEFKCPRCNKLFASPEDSLTNTWTLARKCKHCGLPKYASDF